MNKKKKLLISIIMAIYFALVTAPVEWESYHYFLFLIKSLLGSFILYKFIAYLEKLNIYNIKGKNPTKKTYLYWFFYIFIIMLIALIAYHPIQFTPDLEYQYQEVFTGKYDDWHPLIHTLIFYRFPMLIVKSRLACALFHMLFVAGILLFFCRNLEKYGLNKYIITIILSLFILNPTFDYMAISPVKDSAYSYCIFILTILLINIYFTDGKCLSKKYNIVLFFLACFGITFFRHNGVGTIILFLVPMIFIYKNLRKKTISIFLIILSLRFIFIPFIYKLNHIEKVTFTFSETICVMLNQIAYIYNNNGKITNEQMKTLAKMQNIKKMEQYYDPYNYNSIKYADNWYYKWSPYINSHKKDFLKLWYGLVKNNKMKALKSYVYTTYCIWHIQLDHIPALMDMMWVMLTGNDSINNDMYKQFQDYFFSNKKELCAFPLSLIFITSSVALFVILFLLLYGIFKVKNKLKLLLIYLPVLTNLSIILLMLPGREGRFMYPQLLCSFPLLVFTLLLNQKEKINTKSL